MTLNHHTKQKAEQVKRRSESDMEGGVATTRSRTGKEIGHREAHSLTREAEVGVHSGDLLDGDHERRNTVGAVTLMRDTDDFISGAAHGVFKAGEDDVLFGRPGSEGADVLDANAIGGEHDELVDDELVALLLHLTGHTAEANVLKVLEPLEVRNRDTASVAQGIRKDDGSLQEEVRPRTSDKPPPRHTRGGGQDTVTGKQNNPSSGIGLAEQAGNWPTGDMARARGWGWEQGAQGVR